MRALPKFILFNLLLLIFLIIQNAPISAETYAQTLQVNCSAGQKTVNVVVIDLNDKNIQIESVFARQQIGQMDYLQNIADQLAGPNTEVIAAINGGFFNPQAESPTHLWSTIQQKGEFVHLGSLGSVIGFTVNNRVLIDNLYILLKGSINGHWEEPYNWYAWGLNHDYTELAAVAIYTPFYGTSTGPHERVSIVVEQDVVIAIKIGEAVIPDHGYTIVMDPNNDLLKRFKIGDKLDYKLKYYESDFNQGLTLKGPIGWDGIRTTVSAGPTLLKDGEIIADGRTEGFFEADMIDSRAVFRSFIGVNQKQELIMGNASMVTIKEMAELCKNMGMTQAICLDGGLSSSLYYQGKYISAPFRQITDAIVITRHLENNVPHPPHLKLRRLLIGTAFL